VIANSRFDLVPLLNGGDPDPTEPSEARRGDARRDTTCGWVFELWQKCGDTTYGWWI